MSNCTTTGPVDTGYIHQNQAKPTKLKFETTPPPSVLQELNSKKSAQQFHKQLTLTKLTGQQRVRL